MLMDDEAKTYILDRLDAIEAATAKRLDKLEAEDKARVDQEARIRAQDERIELLWKYDLDHNTNIRKAVSDAASASRSAAASLELLSQILSKDPAE